MTRWSGVPATGRDCGDDPPPRTEKGGCIIGNLSTELKEITHDAFRRRLAECFHEMEQEFSHIWLPPRASMPIEVRGCR